MNDILKSSADTMWRKALAGFLGLVIAAHAFTQTAPVIAQAGNAPRTQALMPVLKQYKVLRNANGTETVQALGATSGIRPGDIIEYRVTYRNASTQTLSGVNAVLPIPASLSFVSNSARPGNAKASIDGRTYAAIPLKRRVRDANGVVKTVNVPFSEYRFLRWSLGNMTAGRMIQVSARARLTPSAVTTSSVANTGVKKEGGR